MLPMLDYSNNCTLNPIIGTQAREAKEETEWEKRKNLLQKAQIQQMSSEVSSSEDDEGAKCSNLRAIALVENETRRYSHFTHSSLINKHSY